MLKKEAKEITGGLSSPSKMPGPSFNLPAAACLTGAKLATVPGSTCSGCYALKGRYRFPNVQAALQRRLAKLHDPRWIESMVTLIGNDPVMRWHASAWRSPLTPSTACVGGLVCRAHTRTRMRYRVRDRLGIHM